MDRRAALAFVLALAPLAAAELPPHLRELPPGAVQVGPAPRFLAGGGAAKRGERLGLWLPSGARAFEVETVQRFADGVEARAGRLVGGGQAFVTLGSDGGFARVTDRGTLWFLEFRDGATYAVRAGAGGLALAADDAGALELAPAAAGARGGRGAPPAATKAAGDGFQTIDLFQLYDPAFAARYPGGLLQTRLHHLVALANQAFVDSGIRAVLRPVGSQLVSGGLDRTIAANVSAMQASLQYDVAFAGIMLRDLRRDSGADLIALHRTQDVYERGACGIAYLPSALTDSTGVSVVNDGASLGSVCDDLVFTHETGHNLGARHQRDDDPTPGRAHGFVLPGRFHTIMGTYATGHPDRALRIGFFSNPRMACGGTACGIADNADNHAEIGSNVGRIAGTSARRLAGSGVPPSQSAPDSDGDGVGDRLDAFPHDPARSVDRDGDGTADADDAFPDNGFEWRDSDGGGMGDNADADDDNDGVADLNDAFPHDPRDHLDADGDGVGDSQDAFPNEPREDRDSDGDGTGDRADADDDADGTTDLGSGATLAESELLVVDGASDRILRFRGSDLAPLGTLVALDEGAATARSDLASGAGGELWFVAGSSLWRLDRLRGEARRVLDAFADPIVGSGFPLTPVLPHPDEVAFAELATARLFATERWRVNLRQYPLGGIERKRLALLVNGRIAATDAVTGSVIRYRYDTALDQRFVPEASAFGPDTGLTRPGRAAGAADGSLYVVDESSGAVHRLDGHGTLAALPGFAAPVGAVAVAVGPDGAVYAALAAGGVRRLDPLTGADLGLALPAGAVAEPLALAWVPRVADGDLAPRGPVPAAVGADPTTTAAVGGTPPVPPPDPLAPCLSGCGGGGGGGGAPDASFAALLLAAALAAARRQRRSATSS